MVAVHGLAPPLALLLCVPLAGCSADVLALLTPPHLHDAGVEEEDAGFAADAAARRDAGPGRDAGPARDASAPRDAEPPIDAGPTEVSMIHCPFLGGRASVVTTLRYCLPPNAGASPTDRLVPESLVGGLTLSCGGRAIGLDARVLARCVELTPREELPALSECTSHGELRVDTAESRFIHVTGHTFATEVRAQMRLGPPIFAPSPSRWISALASTTDPTVTAVAHYLTGSLGVAYMRTGDGDLRWSTEVVPAAPIDRDPPAAAADAQRVRVVWASRERAATSSLWLATWEVDGVFDAGRPILDAQAGIEVRAPQVVQDGERVIVAWTQTCGAPECSGIYAMVSLDGGGSFGAPVRVVESLGTQGFALTAHAGSALIAQAVHNGGDHSLELASVARPGEALAHFPGGFGRPHLVTLPDGRALSGGNSSVAVIDLDGTVVEHPAPLGSPTRLLPGGGMARFTGGGQIVTSRDLWGSHTVVAAIPVGANSPEQEYPIVTWPDDERLLFMNRGHHVFGTMSPFAGLTCERFPGR